LLSYIEDGVMRYQDLSAVLSSSYYHELCAHYATLQNVGVVLGAQYRKQEEAFQDIFIALAWLTTHASKHKGLKRYKGLGEMNPEQLWHSTMDPKHRRLLRIKIEDAANAELLFSILMGDEVAPRRDFIVQNAKYISFKV
jgi:DNA gyrase subunit B